MGPNSTRSAIRGQLSGQGASAHVMPPKGVLTRHDLLMISASRHNPNLGRDWIKRGTPGAWDTPVGMMEDAAATLDKHGWPTR